MFAGVLVLLQLVIPNVQDFLMLIMFEFGEVLLLHIA
jgi:hypothetical protein